MQQAPQPAPAAGRWTYVVVILGAALGMLAGYAPLFNATAGVFVQPLAQEFGWGRSEASLSYAASMFGLAVVSPLVGTMMDRFGIRRVIAASALVFGIATACMALQDGSKTMWVSLSVVVGVFGAATSVLGYLAVLPQWFDRRLGLALGIAMCGLGAGTVLMPATAQYLVTGYGWRTAYVALGLGSIVLSLLACALLRERRVPGMARAASKAASPGVPLREALRSYRLWAIWGVFILASSATLSLGPHLPAMFADKGFSPAEAARSASMVGVGLLVGRILTGVLIDRIHAPFVACVFFVGGAAGIYLLGVTRDYQLLLVAATLIGLTIGAEGDLISYLVRSYFGLRAFGALFGIAFSGYGFGAVIGPIGLGGWFDRHGNYDTALLVLPCMLLAAGALTLSLGRYLRPSTHGSGLPEPAGA
ncbi:MFS transporter [Cupriavidus taiwanensis]|uniref:Putative transporter, Major facilitator superfamily n=1 Tax=Cupriavidus taiwanensis TaxID=164546 RepID=A0A375DP54_9BURK|nr:MFS transporter [Cupriavidus taiwanensis]SOZ09383.1 putative transporter, Major facilitator superfamily [Cupriavidus taiwanensis]SOZ11509.1 putative transporter, Major facilitator superfamily [Cupriavidus taiwanensis]SOZ42863.1 putative transporter, Major facilitator superfamily [Cupriavidus taiwanensis]SPC19535.1 putative transporter, Major facilitator superfamily [Cupriavidus taiwanensis]SPC22111.1 putative transporter, Major facilitator superfamily [Cupriavidus taiwanensis]